MSLPTVIALVIFAVLIAVVYFLTRGGTWTLDKLVYLPGEKMIFTDDAERFEAMFRAKQIKNTFPNAHIVVTNKRILLTQKMLFSKDQYAIRYVINYADQGPELTQKDLMGGALLKARNTKENFLTLYTSTDRMSITDGSIEITIPFKDHGPLFSEPIFNIFTTHVDTYRSVFKK